ncbi:MAG: hypothetical protein JO354_08280 [Verrucomicrobia bacterium]|nr:hypothetical protein [Verrucomicrobiota bacterium]
MRFLAALLAAAPLISALEAAPLLATTQPRIIYSKSFPGSAPAYFQIVLDKNGAAEYKEDPKDDNPLRFQLTEAECSAIFALADKLDHFSRPLESGLKVANMGAKTLRFEGDGPPHETKFNYSDDLDAKTIADWFERIAESERNYIALERAVRFDKLGVQDAILQIEILRNQKRLVAEKQFLPMLDRVANNESYMHMARTRAAALAESIRASR